MRLTVLLMLLFSLSSCEDFFLQEITDFDNGFTPQLSLFALLQPQDSMIIVDVRRTISSIGGDANDPEFRGVPADATVTISDGTTAVPLRYGRFPIEGYLALRDSLPEDFIRPGGTYWIEASHEELTASGTAIVPLDSIERDSIDLSFTRETSGGFTDVYVTAELDNPPGAEDYYVLIVERSSAPNFSNRRRELHDFIQGRPELGERFAFMPVSLREFNKTVLQICVTDAATYDFLNLRNTAVTNAENPFTEPVILPSNVENGVGHLGGLNCQFSSFFR